MSSILLYLAKVSVAIALLSIPYYFILRKDAHLIIKRAYLTGALILAWIFPLLSMVKPEIGQGFEPVFLFDPQAVQISSDPSSILPDDNNTSKKIQPVLFIGLIYLTGIVYIIARSISLYVRNHTTINKSKSDIPDVVLTSQNQVYTLFNKIFVPEKYADAKNIDSILIHERAHIRQLHVIDILISELTLLITWFNPFSWLISRMIKENHEHLADRSVLRQGVNPAHYKALLLNHAMGGEVIRLGHRFNHSLTKNRFNMMKKMKTRKNGVLKYALLLPIILTVTLFVTASAQNPASITGKVYLENNEDPAIGASVVIKGTTTGTVVDRDGSFTLEIEGNPEIVISFVGYKTKVTSAKAIAKKPIVLQPETYVISVPELLKGDADKVAIKLNALEIEGPVFIVDGEQVESIENISTEDIESVSVYKDGENPYVKKYNAVNGLIMIKTKQAIADEKKKLAESEPPVFYVVEDMPSFPGGKKKMAEYLFNSVKPIVESGQTGTVVVRFKVNTDGNLTDIEVVNSDNKSLDEKALDIIKDMPTWNQGKQRGKPVSVNVQMPVRFMNVQPPPAK